MKSDKVHVTPTAHPISPPPPAAATACKRKTGRKKFRETRHPVYRGVRERNGGKWVCEVREPVRKTRIWLGTYPNPELAARAHDVAALALRGEAAVLNFADSAWLVPRAKSCSASDIRMAALQVASQLKATAIQDHSSSSSSSYVSADDARLQETMALELGFWDEEEMFNMPGLIDSMAEAMLLTPPAYKQGVNWDDALASVDFFNLWGY